MPVAKSYQGLEILKDPFEVNGRTYVVIRMKNGNDKQVRWYTEAEYEKMYPEEKPKSEINYRKVFGFDKGYITIFNESNDADEEYLYNCEIPRYCTHWGWYVVSTDEVPVLPDNLDEIRLPWELVGNADGSLKSKEEIKLAVDSLKVRDSASVWIAEPGDRIERVITVVKNETKDNWAGGKLRSNTEHTFEDAEGNLFFWKTQAQNWDEGTTHRVRATVKENTLIGGKKITVLTRCIEN